MKLNNKKKRRENMRYEMCNKRIRVKVNSTTVLTKMDSRRGSNKRSAVLPGSTPENCNRMCRYSDESMIGCEVWNIWQIVTRNVRDDKFINLHGKLKCFCEATRHKRITNHFISPFFDIFIDLVNEWENEFWFCRILIIDFREKLCQARFMENRKQISLKK